ncbi:MAG: LysR substrate-binding domain-containing protein [Paracoccus sp. (in: a-proteobacteria)]
MPDHVVINAVPLMGDLIVPAVMHICRIMPAIRITYRSELGMAELGDLRTIGIRAGAEPAGDDIAVRWLGRIRVALVAAPEYVARNGMPQCPADLECHDIAAADLRCNQTPWFIWVRANTKSQRIVFRTNDENVMRQAIKSGRCMGFLPISSLIWSPELIEVMPAREEWAAPLWLVHDLNANPACCAVGRELADIMARQLA